MKKGGGHRDDQSLAHLCMAVIGIGYLFPISAIWAAFDYWKVLFPHTNVEFVVTGIYQMGSVVTVAALSLSHSVALGPRILGGFAGQFACLAMIFGFRWLAVPATVLWDCLLAVVLLCSIATGYLDSALLALCSQYSPRMQQFLQIGIGFGTLVSVMYRDATKLLMSGDVANATSVYFSVALATVLVCIACYRLLMALPVSSGIRDGSEPLLKNGAMSPLLAATISPLTPISSPLLNGRHLDRDHDEEYPSDLAKVAPAEAAAHGKNGTAAGLATADAGFGAVWRWVRWNQLAIFCNLFLTTLCYPGLITSIPCRQLVALRAEHWFQTLLLTAFTLADIVGRFVTSHRFGLYHGNILLTVLVRAAVFPVIFFCVASPAAGDLLAMAIVAAFGFLNGYCVSLSLMVVNDIPQLNDEQRKTCGRISACSVNGGLCLGSLAAAALAWCAGVGGF